MEKHVISTSGAPAAIGPYSQAVRAGELIFTAGQLGLIPETKLFAGSDIESQTRQALLNLKALLEAGGSCLKHATKTTVFLVELGEFARMNSVYATFFSESCPARSTVQVAALPMGGRIEIEAIGVACDCAAAGGGSR